MKGNNVSNCKCDIYTKKLYLKNNIFSWYKQETHSYVYTPLCLYHFKFITNLDRKSYNCLLSLYQLPYHNIRMKSKHCCWCYLVRLFGWKQQSVTVVWVGTEKRGSPSLCCRLHATVIHNQHSTRSVGNYSCLTIRNLIRLIF